MGMFWMNLTKGRFDADEYRTVRDAISDLEDVTPVFDLEDDMIIFVPSGTDPEDDPTRDSAFYDDIYKYLRSCGIKELM